MARKKIIAGNWKMNMTPSEAVKLVETLKPLVKNDEVDVVFCVPAIDIIPVVEACKDTNIQVGAENMYFEEKGAYTGEISPAMLTDAGVKYVVLGHSERRDYFGETNEDVNKKMLKAFEHGITPIMCCGETLTQREQGVTMDFIPVVEACKDTNIQVGAENMYFEEKGAYTGEISPAMLTDAGVKYVVLGHSERRDYFGETNEDVNKKMLKAFEHGITPIMCCGETLTQREQGVTMDFIRQQVKVGFQGVTADQAKTAVIAYEPIWAIGTGKTATTEQAEEVCAGIRACIAEMYDEATAEAIRIQYGGSVNAGNAAELFAQADIDGGLVGGASLKADFGKIVNYK